jgi:hypothetical protein
MYSCRYHAAFEIVYVISSDFFPVILTFLRQLPFIGTFLSMPYIGTVCPPPFVSHILSLIHLWLGVGSDSRIATIYSMTTCCYRNRHGFPPALMNAGKAVTPSMPGVVSEHFLSTLGEYWWTYQAQNVPNIISVMTSKLLGVGARLFGRPCWAYI